MNCASKWPVTPAVQTNDIEKDDLDWDLVIKTAVKPGRPGLPSRRPFGSVFKTVKAGLQYSGYYDKYDLRRFDPDYLYQKYVGKYSYKPRKRIAGELGRALWSKKKKLRSSSRGKFYQKREEFHKRSYLDHHYSRHSKSSYFSVADNFGRRQSRVYNQSNILFTWWLWPWRYWCYQHYGYLHSKKPWW